MGSRLGRVAGTSDDTKVDAAGGERVAGVENQNPPGHKRTTRKGRGGVDARSAGNTLME